MINLDELEKLANAATPGPYFSSNNIDKKGHVVHVIHSGKPRGRRVCFMWDRPDVLDTLSFFISARTAVPELIREVRRLREALEEYADPHKWKYVPHDDEGNGGEAIGDGGERARKALEDK